MPDKLYFEDVNAGDNFVGDTVTLDRETMLSFARDFDDQPMHLEAEAAQAMGMKDVVACGAYIFALTAKSQRTIWKKWHMLPSGVGLGVSFMLPVYANETLTAHMEIITTRPSSKPGRGWLEVKTLFLNQDGKTAMEITGSMLLLCRPE